MNITNEKVTDYINEYYRPLDDELSDLRIKCEELEIPLILKETENYLQCYLSLNQRIFLRLEQPSAIQLFFSQSTCRIAK